MKILVLAAGPDDVSSADHAYPVALSEFDGHPLIELTLTSCTNLAGAEIFVAMREQESARSHLDDIVKLIGPEIRLLKIRQETKGAACTALLAIDHIDNDEELLILNANEILDQDFVKIVEDFRARELDAGVVVFPAIHPRYSYVRIEEPGHVVEAAEKRPISRTATAGFYWFKQGADFVRAAKRMIEKEASHDGLFYICPALNELVLEEKLIGVYRVDAESYHPLKDDRQIYRYETSARDKKA